MAASEMVILIIHPASRNQALILQIHRHVCLPKLKTLKKNTKKHKNSVNLIITNTTTQHYCNLQLHISLSSQIHWQEKLTCSNLS